MVDLKSLVFKKPYLPTLNIVLKTCTFFFLATTTCHTGEMTNLQLYLLMTELISKFHENIFLFPRMLLYDREKFKKLGFENIII